MRFAASVDLGEIWLFVHEEASEFSVRGLCELYFGNNDLKTHLGLRLALLSDTTYFKRTRESFSPRTPEIVEELKHARDVRERKEQLRSIAVNFAGERLKSRDIAVPSELQPLLNSVADLAALSPSLDHAHQREALEFIEHAAEVHHMNLTGQPERKAYDFLISTGIFDRRTNPRMIRHKPPTEFPPEVLSQAEEIHIPETLEDYSAPGGSARVDLTSLRSFTVDDSSTRDMDDALSIVEKEDGYVLYVHVSDIASFLPVGSLVDQEAMKRATSLYLPEQKIHMLPPVLSEDRLSLIEGQLRPVVTCIFNIDRSYEVRSFEIITALIRIENRYAYEEIDEAILRGVHEFDILHQIASSREVHRITNDGFKVHKRDVSVKVDETGGITLTNVDEDSPARSMIGEMMILANESIARFCFEKGLTIPYRGQEPSDPDNGSLATIPPGPAFDFAIKSRLKRSETSFAPIRHSNLGLEAYTQATSPIRRFLDLCVQRQIVSFLRNGTPTYSPSQFEEIMSTVQEALATAGSVSRESKRYWLYRYLELTAGKGRKIGGTVVRTDLRTPLVELEEIFIAVPARISGSFKPGDFGNFRIVNVDPLSDYIRLESTGPVGSPA